MRYITFVKMAEDIGDPPPDLVEAMGKELQQAFAAPDSAYRPLTAAEVIARNEA